jgi:hypothetical protein
VPLLDAVDMTLLLRPNSRRWIDWKIQVGVIETISSSAFIKHAIHIFQDVLQIECHRTTNHHVINWHCRSASLTARTSTKTSGLQR